MWISMQTKQMWNTWSWKTSCNFTILGCPSQSFRAVISFWVLASILQDKTISLYKLLHQVLMSGLPNPNSVFIYSVFRIWVSKYQNEFSMKWVKPPTRTGNALFLRKRLFLSQKKANHMKKWMPYLPDNLVIRVYNQGGNNRLSKQQRGSQSYL